MGFFFSYPSKCKVCGWDGYESEVVEHCKKAHPGLLERAKELHKQHKKGILSLSQIEDQLKQEFS